MINDSLRIHLSVQSYRLLVEYTDYLYLYLFFLSANMFRICFKYALKWNILAKMCAD